MNNSKRQILLNQVKLQSAGHKLQGLSTSPKVLKNEIFYPCLYLNSDQLDLGEHKVGDTVRIAAEVVIKSKESRIDHNGGKRENVDLEVRKIGIAD